ncbi:MAG: hypothetical protein GXO13_06410, partial [Epsilonproteobacteria bacterium]|nr:hypothetical protein [Campylobacterota bacterium]
SGTIALRNPSAPFPKVDFKTKLTRTQCRYLTQTPRGKVEMVKDIF